MPIHFSVLQKMNAIAHIRCKRYKGAHIYKYSACHLGQARVICPIPNVPSSCAERMFRFHDVVLLYSGLHLN